MTLAAGIKTFKFNKIFYIFKNLYYLNKCKKCIHFLSVCVHSSALVSSQSYSAILTQPIIISDTPSPAVSVITIHSDSDDEDERKFHPAR